VGQKDGLRFMRKEGGKYLLHLFATVGGSIHTSAERVSFTGGNLYSLRGSGRSFHRLVRSNCQRKREVTGYEETLRRGKERRQTGLGRCCWGVVLFGEACRGPRRLYPKKTERIPWSQKPQGGRTENLAIHY